MDEPLDAPATDRWWRLAAPAAMGVAVVVGAVVGIARAPEQVPAAVESPFPAVETTEPGTIVVHVAGEVAHPGLVRVPAGGRVADAIQAAGGVTAAAVLDAVNLAAPVADGAQVVVPDRETPPVATGGSGGGVVSLNQATAAEFETLPGVGPVLAERIVAHRDENGPFESVDDLLDVPGIGEAKLASIRDRVAP